MYQNAKSHKAYRLPTRTNTNMRSSQPSSLPPTNGSYSKRNSTGNAARKSSRSRKTRRRTILHEEYDEFSLKRMSVDDVDGMGAVPSSERREMRRPSMSDLNEGVELTSCSLVSSPSCVVMCQCCCCCRCM